MNKLKIYFNSHMHIFRQIKDIIPIWFHVSMQVRVHTKIEMVASFLFFLSRKKYSRSPSIDFDFYKLSHSYDVVSRKIGWNWHLVTDIFYEFFSISLFKLLKSKYHQISCFVHIMVKSDMKILFPVSLFFFLYIYTLKFDIHVRPFPHP